MFLSQTVFSSWYPTYWFLDWLVSRCKLFWNFSLTFFAILSFLVFFHVILVLIVFACFSFSFLHHSKWVVPFLFLFFMYNLFISLIIAHPSVLLCFTPEMGTRILGLGLESRFFWTRTRVRLESRSCLTRTRVPNSWTRTRLETWRTRTRLGLQDSDRTRQVSITKSSLIIVI